MDNESSIHLTGYGLRFTGNDQNDSHYFENSPLKLEQISAPTSTTDKLYNVGGTLTWNGNALATENETSSAKKNVQTITGSHAANAELVGFADGDYSHVQAGDSFDQIDVFVNGALMTSGSGAYAGYNGNSGDYIMNTGTMNAMKLKFAFALEKDDVVIVSAHN